jgi:polyphosphate glucokinase
MKAAPVDIQKGKLVRERFRLETPQPAKRKAVTQAVGELARRFDWHGPIGVSFPARIKNGQALTASNIHHKWIGTNVAERFAEQTGCPVYVLNDADAAGVAEVAYGSKKNRKGVVLMLTFGTGIGSGLFLDGELVPNTELGHLNLFGGVAEEFAANSARTREELSWEAWAERVQQYLNHVEFLFSPDRIILGGGVSRPHKLSEFFHLLTTNAKLVPAKLQNEAGIIGAAYAARGLLPED